MIFAGVRRWDLIVMFTLLAAVLAFELLGIFSPRMVTITQIIKAALPMPLRFAVYAWLGWHFIVSDLFKK
jgi:hypothetical protein